jgi:hypothetical protein
MTRVCTVCKHKQLEEINKQLLNGTPYRDIAKHFELSSTSLHRHKERHIPTELSKAKEAREVAQADGLLDQVRNLRQKALNLLHQAETSNDLRAAGIFLKELREQIKLWAELEGRLATQPQINILINPQWIGLRTQIITALEPFPQAKEAVLHAIRE